MAPSRASRAPSRALPRRPSDARVISPSPRALVRPTSREHRARDARNASTSRRSPRDPYPRSHAPMRPKPLMATLTFASVTTFTLAWTRTHPIRQSPRTPSVVAVARASRAPSTARSRTFAAARGAVALRKLPASAVRAVSSTVCDRDAQNSFRQSLASFARARARARRPRSPIVVADGVDDYPRSIVPRPSSRPRRRRARASRRRARASRARRRRRRRPRARRVASIAHLNDGGHGVRICDVPRDDALPLVRAFRGDLGSRKNRARARFFTHTARDFAM